MLIERHTTRIPLRYWCRSVQAAWLVVAACAAEPSEPAAIDPAPDATVDAAPNEGLEATPDPVADCCGCLCTDPGWSCSTDTCTADGRVYQLAPEAGFFEIEQGATDPGAPYQRARMWYAFSPADSEPEQKPLALVFQGGPFSSMVILWGGNTAPHTLDPARTEGQAIAPNPHRWTRFANVLYVDSPFAGFSYFLGPPLDSAASARTEAAAFVRLLLRFLARHPKLQRAPVVLVGESYGGMRATLMLQQLLHYPDLELPSAWHHDPALAQEIREHLRCTRGTSQDAEFSPSQIAEQFGTQVLIQGAVVDQFEKHFEPGSGCGSAARASDADPAVCEPSRLRADSDARIEAMTGALVRPAVLRTLTGVDVESIQWLHASERTDASKLHFRAEVVDTSELRARLGELSGADAYYTRFSCPLPCASDARESLSARFVDNLQEVSTFMTLAEQDDVLDPLNVIAELPRAAGVRSIERQRLTERVDDLVVTFQDGRVRKIRFPRYDDSGHTVSLFDPDHLAQDVSGWLRELRKRPRP